MLQPPIPRTAHRGSRMGFTLVELVVVVTIILTLACMFIMSFEPLRDRADSAACAANLRSLHVGFALFTQEHGHWPQMGEDAAASREASAEFWEMALSAYVGKKVWECPTYVRHLGANPEERAKAPRLHYSPTRFDALAFTPYKWPQMPWVTEVGSFHGSGNLILFADGSVQSLDQVLGNKFGSSK